MKLNELILFNGDNIVTSKNGKIEGLDGSQLTNIKISPLSTIFLDNTSFSPINNTIYFYQIVGNEVFVFNNPTNTNLAVNFRLYLVMPDPTVSFTFPVNIEWETLPSFTSASTLYMLAFEWNPVLRKWLGNQMWEPVEVDLNNIGPDVENNGSGDSPSLDVTTLRLSGFSNTIYNGVYDLVDTTATGYNRVWYNSTNSTYIHSTSTGDGIVMPTRDIWVLGTNSTNSWVYGPVDDGTQSYDNPWEISSWSYSNVVDNNVTMFDANGNSLTSNAGWADSTGVTGAVITISNATADSTCNGTYRRTELSSTGNSRIWYCKDNNKYISHFEIVGIGNGHWVVGSDYAPIDTVSNGLYVPSNYADTTNPWDVSSWKIEGTSTTDNMTLLI